MASEDMGLVSAQRLDNGLNPHRQLVFPDCFNCGPQPQQRRVPTAVSPAIGDTSGSKATRELTGFMDHLHHNHRQNHQQYFQQQPQTSSDFRCSPFAEDRGQESRNWNMDSRASATPSADGSEEDEDVDEEDEDDDNEDEHEGLIGIDHRNMNNDNTKVAATSSNSDQIGNHKSQQLSSFAPKEGNDGPPAGKSNYEVRYSTLMGNGNGDTSCSQYVEVMEGSSDRHNGCGFSGRKESSFSSESVESLRTILSDPVTGALMDDAMILPCGHSFGSGGIQHVLQMKACYTCSKPVSEDSVAQNLSLRATVQAYRREAELQVNRVAKKRRERYDQDKGAFADTELMEHPRGRGVQFPFAVSDRVIIKGNKRTPQRFVGREAIVTTQCLNGWYVVKTLDNAESVKLQYRSLAKISDSSSVKQIPGKVTPCWV